MKHVLIKNIFVKALLSLLIIFPGVILADPPLSVIEHPYYRTIQVFNSYNVPAIVYSTNDDDCEDEGDPAWFPRADNDSVIIKRLGRVIEYRWANATEDDDDDDCDSVDPSWMPKSPYSVSIYPNGVRYTKIEDFSYLEDLRRSGEDMRQSYKIGFVSLPQLSNVTERDLKKMARGYKRYSHLVRDKTRSSPILYYVVLPKNERE